MLRKPLRGGLEYGAPPPARRSSRGMDERSREIRRRFEWPLLAFALLTIPAIAIEYGDAGQPWQTIGTVLNWTIWLAFVLEFVVMPWVVPDRWLWVRKNPLDLAIVVLTPPFLPESLQAARVFRLFVLLRLAKAGVLIRHLPPPKAFATLPCWV